MTLCVKDEVDVLDAQLAFHLNAGVDFVIVTDTGSTDGTLEVIEPYRRAGLLGLNSGGDRAFRQADARTTMARLAAPSTRPTGSSPATRTSSGFRAGRAAHRARGRTATLRRRRRSRRTFVARPDDGRPFHERMTFRLATPHAVNDPTSKFRPNVKVVHRGHPQVRVTAGNHDVADHPLPPLRGWYPIEVLHFPVRSASQLTVKWKRARDHVGSEQVGYIRRSVAAGDERRAYDELVVADDELARGSAAGVLVEDTRIRDALRSLAPDGAGYPVPERPQGTITFGVPSVVDDALYAADIAALGEAEVVRVQRRLDTLERRLGTIERNPAVQAVRGLRWLARRVGAGR